MMSTTKFTRKAIAPGIAVISLICLSSLCWCAKPTDQLTNTKWKGIAFVPNPQQVIIHFKKDTLIMSIDEQIIETEYCHVSGDTLTMKKIDGGSPCTDEIGTYRYMIKTDNLLITPLRDECMARSSSFSTEGYESVKN